MIFVVGTDGRLEVYRVIRVQSATIAHQAFTNKPVKIGPWFMLRRGPSGTWVHAPMNGHGVAEEKGGFRARVLPVDAERELAELDDQIDAAERVLAELRKERQAFLAASIMRGERISKKHVPETSAQ